MSKITIDISKGWMPDLLPEDVLGAGGLVRAINVLPISSNYVPILDKAVYNSTAVTGTPLQGIYVQDTAGDYYNFLGTSTKLYRFTKSAMTDVSKSGVTYAGAFWNYALYGNWLIATDYEYVPQVLKEIGSATNFVDLGGSPPKAKYCCLCMGHLVLGYTYSGSTSFPKRIQWSARENPELWTTSLATGADTQDLPEMMGVMTGLANIGDGFGVFSEDSITTCQYIGGTYTFNIRRNLIKGIGCFYPGSLISIGDVVFFWSKNTAYQFDGASYPQEIGYTLRNTVFNDVNTSYSDRIAVCHDRLNGIILWAYPSQASTGTPDKIVCYNYIEKKWTSLNIVCNTLFAGATGGFPIDDSTLTNVTIESLASMNIDSAYWLGKTIQPLAVDTNLKVSTFSGSPLQAELETGEISQQDIMLSVQKAYLPIDGLVGAGVVVVKHRYSNKDSVVYDAAQTIRTDGDVDLRTTDRRISLNIKATNFTRIGKVITAEGVESGRR